MKFKLDENLGKSALLTFESRGHDTSSIHRQEMEGATDSTLFRVCSSEQRVLVTLDLDFANPLIFDPHESAGVAALRLPKNPAPSELTEIVSVLLNALDERSINWSLWIVRADKIRVGLRLKISDASFRGSSVVVCTSLLFFSSRVVARLL